MRDKETKRVQVDGYTRLCLTAITVLLTLLVIGLWADRVDTVSPANAGSAKFQDAEAKNALSGGRWGTSSASGKTVAAQKQTNEKLDQLIGLFRSGQAKVQVMEPAGKGGGNVSVTKSKE